MELCNGGDLKNFLETRGGALREYEARHILMQIKTGLVELTKEQIMHRDLKLANIMINFSDVTPKAVLDCSFKLDSHIKKFDFQKQLHTLTCKIADLGLACKISAD